MEELRPAPRQTSIADVCRLLRIPSKPGHVSGLSLDSRTIQPGDLYAALPGEHTHGANFAAQAIAAGASAILTDLHGASIIADVDVPVLTVPIPREALGAVAKCVYAGPRPRLIGVTGTNGKTTTTHFIAAVLAATEHPTAVVGTLGVHFGNIREYSGRTTPEAPALHAALQAVAEAGAEFAAMEVSSHALALHRVDGLRFDVTMFLGLTQDHLDFHGTMDRYFEAKARLFDPLLSSSGIISIDDEWGRKLADMVALDVSTYGMSAAADWTARDVVFGPRTTFVAVGPDVTVPVTLSMPGDFNVANALGALAVAHRLGLDLDRAAQGLAEVQVPGRFESVPNQRDVTAYADYAHTPDAVERVLAVARSTTSGRVIAVLGCGGDRDASKRPLMGAAAAGGAEIVIVTDDNPRSEQPADIRRAILGGIPAGTVVEEIGDRSMAIARAVELAQPGDCIMVLGKGHETGQEIAGVMHDFDDRVALRNALAVSA